MAGEEEGLGKEEKGKSMKTEKMEKRKRKRSMKAQHRKIIRKRRNE
jgi:hypothetical protein